ncbi:MAG: oligosaccharide flippase family protein [Oscillospiraceae bacterium]|nr:oligosaccharide flippase family protein [Oscillospiraceae bacterium]
MNKYRKLLSNTFLFALSSFSSKVLSILLMPFYTSILQPAESGLAGLVVQTGNLLLPLVSIGIATAVIRFGLDNAYDKRTVFVNGFAALGIGTVCLLCLYPLLTLIADIGTYAWLMCLFVVVSTARNLCSQFVRAKQYTRLYAIDGLLNTLLMLTFTILFLGPLQLGIIGYVGAIVCADFLSGLFLWSVANLGKYFRISYFNRGVFAEMLRYSLPLVPASMLWWITNASDRYLIKIMTSLETNGLYDLAYKIPGIVVMFSTIFTEAWQLSAVSEDRGKGRVTFFSNVFLSYQAVVFCVGSGLIYFCQLGIKLLAPTNPAYHAAWQYVPLLIIATVYSCFVSFIGSVYMVEKRSTASLMTMLVGAVSNVVLNFVLIPVWGANGAAFATFFCYFIIFVVRAINCRRYIAFDIHPIKMGINTLLLAVQSVMMLMQINLWQVWSGLVLVIVLAINFGPLLQSARKLLKK